MNIPVKVQKWAGTTKKVIFSPVNFFSGDFAGSEGSLRYGIISLFTFIIFSGLFFAGFMTVSVLKGVPAYFLNSKIVTGLLAVTGAMMSASLITVFMAILGSFFLIFSHLLVKILGGKSYRETLKAVSYPTGVLAVAGWIPFLNILSMIYWVFLSYLGFREAHRISNLRALVSILPLALMMVVFIRLTLRSNKVIGLIL